MISRGWINAQNVNNNYSKVALVNGEYNKYSFDMIPTDYTFKCNHKLGLIIYGTDPEETVRKTETTKVKVKLNTIDVNIPVV
jgi:X-Pro dipeptidyl-peptidase